MLAPNLTPALDRALGDLSQTLPPSGRNELLAALDHIARDLEGDPKPVAGLKDPRVPRKARAAICAITPFGFQGSWLAHHQRPWAAADTYEDVLRAATATALHAKAAPELAGVPRYRVELLNNVLWLMTVAPSGKYTTRFRSEGAVADAYASLRHEHVFTRQRLVADLLAAAPDEVEGLLRSHAVGCTVTDAEHKRLTPFDKTHNGWDRYAAAEVAVLDMSTGKTLNLG